MDSNPMLYDEDYWSEDKMKINGSSRLMNSSSLSPYEISLNRPPWVSTTLGCFLIFTIVVDILGNLLVIFSVCRNKKLRNAGKVAFKTNMASLLNIYSCKPRLLVFYFFVTSLQCLFLLASRWSNISIFLTFTCNYSFDTSSYYK